MKAIPFYKNFALFLAIAVLSISTVALAGDMNMSAHTSGAFSGPKVNGGTVTHSKEGGKNVLTLSDDFVAPQTPDPHWQVIDSKGNVYLLDKLMVKPDKFKKSITLPSYVPDVVKVQIWCAFAETVLGEASFQKPMM